MAILFGWEIRRPEKDVLEKKVVSFAPPQNDDGAVTVTAGGHYGTYVDLDGTVKTEADLITKYREMSLHPEIDAGIVEIINESIVSDDGNNTVDIILDDCKFLEGNDKIQEIITQEFKKILTLLEFQTKSYEVFKRWYIDGRLYYHVIIDEKNPLAGIIELRYLDPRKIRKIREVAKKKERTNPSVAPIQTVAAEYYIYNEAGLSQKKAGGGVQTQGIKIAPDSIGFVSSGLVDSTGTMVLGYLHKAIKALNQLRALEDATVIYRLSRAPERRIFYIDVGNLPKVKAEQYVTAMMNKHKNKLVYDASTGEIRDDRKFMTMLEDYWMPRREGGKGTEITTLPGGENLGQMQDVEYFQHKLYNSLNVPISRLDPESIQMIGRATEITRDEVKFAKFIDRLRLKFSDLFLKLLEKQLILRAVMTPGDWEAISKDIKFRYTRDNYFSELKDLEIFGEKIMRLEAIVPYAGVYFSHAWIRKNILKQSDEEIEQMDMEIAMEEGDPQYEKLSFMTPGGGMVPPPGEEPFPPEGGEEGEEGEEGPPGQQQGQPQNGPPQKGKPPGGSQKKPPPK